MIEKMVLIHTEGVPPQRNRAVHQRPVFFSQHYDLHIFTFSRSFIAKEVSGETVVHRYPNLQLKFLGPLSYYLNSFLFLFWGLLEIKRMLKDVDNLAVYTFHSCGFSLGGAAKFLFRKKIVWFVDMQHSPYYYKNIAKRTKSFPRRIFYQLLFQFKIRLFRKFLPKADLVIVMSHSIGEGFAKLLLENFSIAPSTFYALPNGVDIQFMTQYRSTLTEEHMKDNFSLVFAGNISKEKMDPIFNSLSDLIKQIPELTIHLAGDVAGDYRGEFQSRIEEFSDRVEYFGRINYEEVIKLYQRSDVGFFFGSPNIPDHNFSHPGKVFEYMALGMPVVATYLEGVSRIVTDGEDGFLIHDNDFKAIIYAIARLYEEPELRKKMGDRAMENVKRFDWTKLNEKLFERLSGVLDESSKKNVLVLSASQNIQVRVQKEVSSLFKAGYKVKILAWNRNLAKPNNEIEVDVEAIEIKSTYSSIRILLSVPLVYYHFSRAILKNRVDILHCTDLKFLPLAISLKPVKKYKVVYDAFEIPSVTYGYYIPRLLNPVRSIFINLVAFMELILAYFVDGVLTVDSKNNYLKKRFSRVCKNTTMLYNVPCLDDFKLNMRFLKSINTRYQGRHLLIYAGNLIKEQMIYQLIQAAPLIRDKEPNTKILMMGSVTPMFKEKVNNFIENNNLTDIVEVLDRAPYKEMLAYIDSSDICFAFLDSINPKYRLLGIGNSRKIFTYMLFSKPIIASDIDAYRLVEEYNCGILVESEKPARIAQATLKLLGNAHTRKEMGKNGRKLVEEKFNWELEENKLLKLYGNLCQ